MHFEVTAILTLYFWSHVVDARDCERLHPLALKTAKNRKRTVKGKPIMTCASCCLANKNCTAFSVNNFNGLCRLQVEREEDRYIVFSVDKFPKKLLYWMKDNQCDKEPSPSILTDRVRQPHPVAKREKNKHNRNGSPRTVVRAPNKHPVGAVRASLDWKSSGTATAVRAPNKHPVSALRASHGWKGTVVQGTGKSRAVHQKQQSDTRDVVSWDSNQNTAVPHRTSRERKNKPVHLKRVSQRKRSRASAVSSRDSGKTQVFPGQFSQRWQTNNRTDELITIPNSRRKYKTNEKPTDIPKRVHKTERCLKGFTYKVYENKRRSHKRNKRFPFVPMCLLLLNNIKLPWSRANSVCEDRGGHLAILNVQVRQKTAQQFLKYNKAGLITAVQNMLSNRVWIGLKTNEWLDGSPLTYKRFSANTRPTSTNACVSASLKGKILWMYEPCMAYRYFLCESKPLQHRNQKLQIG